MTEEEPAQQEPIYQYQMANGSWIDQTKESHDYNVRHGQATVRVVYTSPPAERRPLTAREIELIDGMIEVQLDHAARCANIPNRVMAEKQKGWDMERVELLRKLKEKNK